MTLISVTAYINGCRSMVQEVLSPARIICNLLLRQSWRSFCDHSIVLFVSRKLTNAVRTSTKHSSVTLHRSDYILVLIRSPMSIYNNCYTVTPQYNKVVTLPSGFIMRYFDSTGGATALLSNYCSRGLRDSAQALAEFSEHILSLYNLAAKLDCRAQLCRSAI